MSTEKHFFIDWLKARKAYSNCYCCGVCDWRLLIDQVTDITNQELTEFSFIHFQINRAAARGVGVLLMVCGNCGLVRPHLKEMVTGEFKGGPSQEGLASFNDDTT